VTLGIDPPVIKMSAERVAFNGTDEYQASEDVAVGS
jgi:hypothetical protein